MYVESSFKETQLMAAGVHVQQELTFTEVEEASWCEGAAGSACRVGCTLWYLDQSGPAQCQQKDRKSQGQALTNLIGDIDQTPKDRPIRENCHCRVTERGSESQDCQGSTTLALNH